MKRIKCIVAYDGTNFSGYQIQPGKRTVQGELEKVLQQLHKGEPIKVYASGRTDAQVHAKGQVIHFDTPLSLPIEKWPVALNTLLPEDIAVLETEEVEPTFHARFQATGKEYRYFVLRKQQRDPFKRFYTYRFPYDLDIEKMRIASKYLMGTHDFTSFCSAKTEIEDRIRDLWIIDIKEEGELLVFRFVGSGFLYNMVRILVGTLLDVGNGKIAPLEVKEILDKKDRTAAGRTAPPEGLFLWEVFYD